MSSSLFDHHVIGVVSTNCYVFGNPSEAIMFDPGGQEAIQIVDQLQDRGIDVKHVIATHGHFDHLGWATEVQNELEGAKVYLHEAEKPVYEDFIDWMGRYDLPPVELREPDVWIRDQQLLDLGGFSLRVLHTPGHSPGSATFTLKGVAPKFETQSRLLAHETAFVGDTLFAGSIGRVDLPYANSEDMAGSLQLLMDELSPEMEVFPGHGPLTVMKNELATNPFLRALQQGRRIF